jgi:hypothetical protein
MAIVLSAPLWLWDPVVVRFVLPEFMDVMFQLSAESAFGLGSGVRQFMQELLGGLQHVPAFLGEPDVGGSAVITVLPDEEAKTLQATDHASQALYTDAEQRSEVRDLGRLELGKGLQHIQRALGQPQL